jgi:DNA replication protein DnaC
LQQSWRCEKINAREEWIIMNRHSSIYESEVEDEEDIRSLNDTEIYTTLLRKSLSNAEHKRVSRIFPSDYREACPTCSGKSYYRLDGIMIDCDCAMQMMLRKHYLASNIPKEYHDIGLAHFIGEDRDDVTNAITDYLDQYEQNRHYGLGLTIAGAYGNGKTFTMNIILKERVKAGDEVFFITFEDLINTWGSAWSNDESQWLMDKLKRSNIVGIDDLRTDGRNSGGFLANGLDALIRHRTSNQLPTLITTNMTPAEIEKEYPRIHSLLGLKNDWLVLVGKDVRMREIRNETRRLRDTGERRPVC